MEGSTEEDHKEKLLWNVKREVGAAVWRLVEPHVSNIDCVVLCLYSRPHHEVLQVLEVLHLHLACFERFIEYVRAALAWIIFSFIGQLYQTGDE